MDDRQDKINELTTKLEQLYSRQKDFILEMKAIKQELERLKRGESPSLTEQKTAPTLTPNLPEQINPVTPKPTPRAQPIPKQKTGRLARNTDKKLIAGVCAGIADRLEIHSLIVRIVWVILTLFSMGIGIVAYVLLWFVMAPTGRELADGQYGETYSEPGSSSNYNPLSPATDFGEGQERRIGTSSIGAKLEKFIGGNLISIVGIVITILGVSIGVKYSIENELISPVTRVVLGYIAGIVLLLIGFKLKDAYLNFSAILVSGAMAIFYFITFSAHAYYDLIPQLVAFGMMFLLTLFTVFAAIKFDREIIAHIGLVGAYAVPFLLSDGSDAVFALFSYMAIINIGILAISYWKYWKRLYYSAFFLTWSTFVFWYLGEYSSEEHRTMTLSFLGVFFVTFYLIFLAYKVVREERFQFQDILFLLLNSVVFYAIGYHILNDQSGGKELLGLFTLGNALIHYVVSLFIYNRKLADKQLFYFVSGLVLVFVTLSIPVQLDGNWVTLCWAAMAALLFWIGRSKEVHFYELISYPLMVLACLSIGDDWNRYYNYYYNPDLSDTRVTPILNIHLLSTALFVAAFAFVHFINKKALKNFNYLSAERLTKVISYSTLAIVIVGVFTAFHLEISNYFNQLYKDSLLTITENGRTRDIMDQDIRRFRDIWRINFTMFFVSVIGFFGFSKIRDERVRLIFIGFVGLTALMFLLEGLYVLGSLRDSYVDQSMVEYYNRGAINIYIRYISIVLFAIMMAIGYKYSKQGNLRQDIRQGCEIFLHASILWVISSELLTWTDLLGQGESDKIGMSILWGLYSLFLIVMGIRQRKAYLRIAAIVLFAITLAKLFFYDIAHLDTIAKTIVLVSLGVLLLFISFLYNKFKPVDAD